MITGSILFLVLAYLPIGFSMPLVVYSLGAVITYVCSIDCQWAMPTYDTRWHRALKWSLVALWLGLYAWFIGHYMLNADMPVSVLVLESIIVSLILMIWKTNLSFYLIHKPWALRTQHKRIIQAFIVACVAELYVTPFQRMLVSERLMICSEFIGNVSIYGLCLALSFKGYMEYRKPNQWWRENSDTPINVWGPVKHLAEGLRYYVIRFIMLGHNHIENIDIIGMTYDKPEFLDLPWWRKQLRPHLPNIDEVYTTLGPEGTLLMLTHCNRQHTPDPDVMTLPENLY